MRAIFVLNLRFVRLSAPNILYAFHWIALPDTTTFRVSVDSPYSIHVRVNHERAAMGGFLKLDNELKKQTRQTRDRSHTAKGKKVRTRGNSRVLRQFLNLVVS